MVGGGAIRSDSQKILIQCPPRLGSQEYQQILERGLPALYTPQMVFMQDRALVTGIRQQWDN